MCLSLTSSTSFSRDVRLTTGQECVTQTHPSAEIATVHAACQAGVKVRNSIRSTDGLVLMYLTTTVNVAASSQVPVRHGERRAERENRQTVNNVY